MTPVRFAIRALAFLLAAGAWAASLPPTAAILFVGNSFTHAQYLPAVHYNGARVMDENQNQPPMRGVPGEPRPVGGIPGIFKELTDEAGFHYSVHCEVVNAMPLEFHYEHALGIIARPAWGAVILQGLSTEAIPESRGGRRQSFFKYATLLERAIHAANPATRVYLYETWPRANLVYPPGTPYHGLTVAAMAGDVRAGYEQEFNADGHFSGIARAGDAWVKAMTSGLAEANPNGAPRGQLDLWGPDQYHPSAPGAYLAALAIFHAVTGLDPQTLGPAERAARDLGVPAAAVTRLQAAAEW